MKIELKPWMVPNYCIQVVPPRRRQDIQEAPTYPLAEVDAETLAQMCDDFRAEVFRKAGKPDPKAGAR